MSLETVYSRVCRTCLIESATMKPVFSVEVFTEPQAMLCDILMSCASVQVVKEDGLPQQVCLNCAQEMNRAYLFRKLCEKSDTTLRNYFDSLLPIKSEPSEEENASMQEAMTELKSDSILVEIPPLVYFQNLRDETSNFDYLSCQNNDSKYEDPEEVKGKPVENISEKLSSDLEKNNYNCGLCEEICFGLEEYRTHMVSPHNQLFNGEVYGKGFNSETTLENRNTGYEPVDARDGTERFRRQSKPHKSKARVVTRCTLPRTCTTCNKTFPVYSKLARHILTHTGEKPYYCKACGKSFSQLSYLKLHSFTHTGEKPYKCTMCDKSFSYRTPLVSHLRTHTGKNDSLSIRESNPYKNKVNTVKKPAMPRICTICNKSFVSLGNLERHMLIHTGEKPYLCNVCGKGFNQPTYLKIHAFIHTGEKPYKCKMCDKSFSAPGTLLVHSQTHTEERSHVCQVCGKAFTQSRYLLSHIKTHEGEKKFECKLCQKRFYLRHQLTTHMRTHSGEKPYSCEHCGRNFGLRATLKKHVRIHTGERPFVCAVCGQAFAHNSTLFRHKRIHRPK